ncbi:MAG: hypothetical protein J6V52_05305 [Bacteroidaceae bacterium]|nr:hypothetical protein [Bacteroidaceae bacterium]
MREVEAILRFLLEWLGLTLIFEGVAEARKEKRLFNVNSLAGLVIIVLATWLLR